MSTELTNSWFNLSKEDIDVILPKSKPNQKQFKQFDETLFRAYISKISDEDKEKCFEILMRNLDIQKAELINDGVNLNLVFVRF